MNPRFKVKTERSDVIEVSCLLKLHPVPHMSRFRTRCRAGRDITRELFKQKSSHSFEGSKILYYRLPRKNSPNNKKTLELNHTWRLLLISLNTKHLSNTLTARTSCTSLPQIKWTYTFNRERIKESSTRDQTTWCCSIS